MLSHHNRKTPIGLDIGRTGVRAVQLSRAHDVYTIIRASRSECQEFDPDPQPDTSESGRRVRTCVRQAEFSGRTAVTALDLPDIEFHSLEIPSAPPEELERVVRWEVERLTAHPPDSIEARHWSLPATPVAGPNALALVAPRGTVLEAVAACREGGLLCACVDAAATALARFGAMLNTWNPDEVWGVLDLGHRQTRLILCVNDIPVLVRVVGSGGGTWTQRIADSLQTTTKTAEIHKRDHGVALTGRARQDERPDASRSELSSLLLGILRGELKAIAAEVKRSYEYVMGCYSGRSASDLVTVGGGAAMLNLPEFLNEALGIQVHRASTYLKEKACRLQYASGRQNPLEVFAKAIGLALPG